MRLQRQECYYKAKNIFSKLITVFLRLLLIIPLGFLVLYPIIFMVSRAFMPANSSALDPSIVWLPKQFSTENFQMAIEAMDYWKSLFTTLRIEVLSGLIEVFTCAIAAYGLSRYKFKGQNFLFILVMITIIVPSQAILIPMYLNDVHLDFFGILNLFGKITGQDIRPNIIDTGWAFYLPAIFGTGYRSGLFIFIYRQFFKGLPKELEEASWIDGYGPFRTFLKIVLPTSGPAILCVTIFSLIWHWNEYYLSAMLIFNRSPLSVSVSMMTDTLWNMYHVKGELASNIVMCACLLMILPILLIYLWLQKYFMESIERVGIVG